MGVHFIALALLDELCGKARSIDANASVVEEADFGLLCFESTGRLAMPLSMKSLVVPAVCWVSEPTFCSFLETFLSMNTRTRLIVQIDISYD
jgi:hypothetical protein